MAKKNLKENSLVQKVALFAVGSSSWQGGIQYIINFIAGLNIVAQNQNSKIHILLLKGKHQNFDNLDEFLFLDIKILDIQSDIPKVGALKKIYYMAKSKLLNLKYSPRMIDFLKAQEVDFVYPNALPISSGLNAAGWVADFQHRHFPDIINRTFTMKAEKWVLDELKYSNKVVISSDSCQQDCARFYPEYLEKTVVMPFAVHLNKSFFNSDLLAIVKAKYNIINPFLIVSNLFAKTKNHKVIFEALRILKNSGLILDLFCTGNIVDERDIGFANDILNSIALNGLSRQVHLLGLIPREDQISLFRLSMAMVQPSLSEGWSTSVEEAKLLGKDMLLSNIDVHREQWPNNPWFFNPNDPFELSKKINELFEANKKKEFPELEKESFAIYNYKNNFNLFANAIQKVIDFNN